VDPALHGLTPEERDAYDIQQVPLSFTACLLFQPFPSLPTTLGRAQAKQAGERRTKQSELVVLNRKGLGYKQIEEGGIPKVAAGPSEAELHKIMEKAKNEGAHRKDQTAKAILTRVGRGHRFKKTRPGKASASPTADRHRREAHADAEQRLAEDRVNQLERKLLEEKKEKESQDKMVTHVEEELAKAKADFDTSKSKAKARKEEESRAPSPASNVADLKEKMKAAAEVTRIANNPFYSYARLERFLSQPGLFCRMRTTRRPQGSKRSSKRRNESDTVMI